MLPAVKNKLLNLLNPKIQFSTNDDTIAADIAGNNADNNDIATVLHFIAFAEKGGRPDPISVHIRTDCTNI